MMKRPNILISNDDGFTSDGIRNLASVLSEIADITLVAPNVVRSGASTAITTSHPIELIKVDMGIKNVKGYATTGMPADCIKLALNVLYEGQEKPDLVVAGINHGRNDAICVIYSGTIGAAMEACAARIPSLAVSLDDHGEHPDFEWACYYAKLVVEKILEGTISMPNETLLSLNIPRDKPIGLKICQQGDTRFVKEYNTIEDDRGKTLYKMVGHQINKNPEQQDNDFEWLTRGYATLTPIQINLTDVQYLSTLKNIEENLN